MDPAALGRLAVEAGTSILLPCSATVIVPAALIAVLGRGRTGVVVGVLGGAIVGAVGVLGLLPRVADPLIGLALAAGAVAVVVAGPVATHRRVVAPVGAAIAGLGSGLLWTPCVGAELGALLTTGVRDPWPAVMPLALFLAVLCLPVVALAAAARTPVGTRVLTGWPIRVLGLVAIGVGVAVAVGLGDDVTGALFRWST